MDTLRLVEVTGDGALVLMTGDGRRFTLDVDEQLRSAVRRSRHGTHVTPGPDRPGPREVQARIRAGADAEQVAAQTGLDVDYVRRFEGPVLAERAHVADLARSTAVDRGGDPGLTLEGVVLDLLTGEGYDVDDITWDSRRSEGTRWQVAVVSRAGSARTEATWSFDTATRALEPVDAEAERLTGVERRRRLSAVRDSVFDVERPASAAVRGGTVELLDALARQRGRRPAPPPARDDAPEPTAPGEGRESAAPGEGRESAEGPADAPAATGTSTEDAATDTAAPGAGSSGTAASDIAATGTDASDAEAGPSVTAPADEGAAPVSRNGSTVHRPEPVRARPSRLPVDASADGLRVVPARPAAGRDQAELSIEPDLLSELDLDHADDPRHPAPVRVPGPASRPEAAVAGERRARRRRTAVPSWDEIVFGAKREDG